MGGGINVLEQQTKLRKTYKSGEMEKTQIRLKSEKRNMGKTQKMWKQWKENKWENNRQGKKTQLRDNEKQKQILVLQTNLRNH